MLRRDSLLVSRWAKDEELVALSQRGSENAAEMLLSRYRPMVENKARTYFLQGAEQADVVQEGMLGLCKAMRDYRVGFRAHFRLFAETCVSRQIISAVIRASRQKHRILTDCDSLFQSQNDDESIMLQDCLTDPFALSPYDLYCRRLDLQQRLWAAQECLSPMECRVCRAFLQGKPYRQIADDLRLSMKSVDNALQRIRAKLSSLPITESRC
jgi:RNA polymerase sporulation-specific sigma factor